MKLNATVLYFAGLWNLIGGALALADPASHFRQGYHDTLALSDHLQQFFFRAVWINVMAWGVGYILASRMTPARVPILVGGAMGKLAYCIAALALVKSGVGNHLFAATALGDALFAAVFAYIVVTGDGSRRTEAVC